MKSPCKDCPYRKDSLKGWLSRSIEGLLAQTSFVCHKKQDLQCAGHMLLRGEKNDFVKLANRLSIPLGLSGRELVFDNEADCIAHHKSEEDMPLEITDAHSQYLVTWDGLWGRGESMEAAQRNRLPHFLPSEKLPKMPATAMVWKTTSQTRISENGSISHPKDTPAPVRLNPKTLKPMGAR